jgi:uncharacterized protein (DUF488 family)
MREIYTIGHSNHSIEHFIELLAAYRISTVVDVRSSPHSKYSPHFDKDVLEIVLRNADVDYVFLGKELGAQRSEDSCYIDGQAKYYLIAQLPIFRRGLEEVLLKCEHDSVALMCAESDPIKCHRTIMVCRELKKLRSDLEINHIMGDSTSERQEALEKKLVNFHKLQPELFGNLTSISDLIEKAYDLQAEKIEYRKVLVEA